MQFGIKQEVSKRTYHFADDVSQRSELAADVEEVKDADHKDGDDETVEDASVGDESGHETDCEPGEEQRDDDGVDEVPHVTVEHAQLLTELGRLTDQQLHRDTHSRLYTTMIEGSGLEGVGTSPSGVRGQSP